MVGYREKANAIHDGTLVLKYRPEDIEHQERLIDVLGPNWGGFVATSKAEPNENEIEALAWYHDGNAEFLAILPTQDALENFLEALKYLRLDGRLTHIFWTIAPVWSFTGDICVRPQPSVEDAIEEFFPDTPSVKYAWLTSI